MYLPSRSMGEYSEGEKKNGISDTCGAWKERNIAPGGTPFLKRLDAMGTVDTFRLRKPFFLVKYFFFFSFVRFSFFLLSLFFMIIIFRSFLCVFENVLVDCNERPPVVSTERADNVHRENLSSFSSRFFVCISKWAKKKGLSFVCLFLSDKKIVGKNNNERQITQRNKGDEACTLNNKSPWEKGVQRKNIGTTI